VAVNSYRQSAPLPPCPGDFWCEETTRAYGGGRSATRIAIGFTLADRSDHRLDVAFTLDGFTLLTFNELLAQTRDTANCAPP
jgi:hypothetical protein